MTPDPALRLRAASDPSGAPQDELVLEVEGRPFAAWTSFRLKRELGACSGSFEIEGTIEHPFPIRAGARVRVLLGGLLAATGNVDAIRCRLSGSEHAVEVGGRDLTADLHDCSIHEDLGELSDVYLTDVAHLAASPYDVELHVLGSGDPFPKWRFNTGETAWAAIERACRLRGRLAYADEEGALVIEAPARRRAEGAIVEGLADLDLRWEDGDRFQTYLVRGQGRGSDSAWGSAVAAVEGSARDFGVRRPRVLVVVAETSISPEDAEARALWERAVRSARSAFIEAGVQGWRQTPGGRLWRLNELVYVDVPRWGFRDVLLVDGLEFSRSEEGTRTTLRLARKTAYDPEPAPSADPFEDWAGEPASDALPDEGEGG